MILECVVDTRERDLWDDLVPVMRGVAVELRQEMLVLGDVLVRDRESGEVLLMMERKSVRDLAQSLRDGRHHDQRRRWLDFRGQSPNTVVALWVEGDLMAAPMDEVMRSSLLNSLFRAQTKHHVLVHHARTRDAFVRSIRFAVEKLLDDPRHLLPDDARTPATPPPTNMTGFKKSAHSVETHWRDCLSLIPGVSPPTAAKVVEAFPSVSGFVRALTDDQDGVVARLSGVRLSDKRKLGVKLAERIVGHFADKNSG